MRVAFPPSRIFLLAAALLAGCNLQPEAELAAFGDSVTWGYGDLPGGWVRRIEEESGYSVSNLGVPGERVDGATGRIDAALRTVPKAKVVFVLHGGNNWVKAFRSSYCNRACDPAEVEDKYDAVGDALRKVRRAIDRRGMTPVFLTYWPSSPGKCRQYDEEHFTTYQLHRKRLNAEIAEVAAEEGDHVILTGEMEGFGEDNDFFDCLHPSAQGYKKIADRIFDDFAAWEPPEPGPQDLTRFHF